jgi:SAM-dependent methyltransferase
VPPEAAAGGYVGGELALLAHAVRWKAYLRDLLAADLRGDVLEVGAGQGATTRALRGGGVASWLCLEPDAVLARGLERAFADEPAVSAQAGTIASLASASAFDVILYVDVLEHVEDDREELARAAAHLRPGGALIVVAPSHAFLFSPFDRAIGHHRRYSRRTLAAAGPGGLHLERLLDLDAAGFLASLGNRLVLRRAMPTLAQILFWDRRLVPVSRVVDAWLGFRAGKSLLAVWRRSA